MAVDSTASAGPRYAPDDPTLPKPWRGLIDGKTGYLYYWNPETNVTQYEKPVVSSNGHSSARPSSGYVSSSVQVNHSSHGPQRDGGYVNDDDDNRVRGRSREKYQQSAKDDVALNGGGGLIARHEPLENGSGLSAEAYRRRHEISVSGDSVPPPFMTFEATGFPSEILREMRYLLLGELMSYAVLPLFYAGPLFEMAFESSKFVAGLLLVMIQSATWSKQKKRPPPAVACVLQAFATCIGGWCFFLH